MTLTIDLKWYSGSAIVSRMSEYLAIVDIFRATSMIPTLLERGAGRILPVALVEEALQLKERHPDYLLAGEDRGRMPQGFSFGNSPSTVYTSLPPGGLAGRTIVHRSSAGTQAISRAVKVKKEQNARYTIFTSSLLNAAAVGRRIAGLNGGRDERLTILCSGYLDKIYALEDEIGAGALIEGIVAAGSEVKLSEVASAAYLACRGAGEEMASMLRPTKSAVKIIEVGDEPDIEFCCRRNMFDIVPVVRDGAVVRDGQE